MMKLRRIIGEKDIKLKTCCNQTIAEISAIDIDEASVDEVAKYLKDEAVIDVLWDLIHKKVAMDSVREVISKALSKEFYFVRRKK